MQVNVSIITFILLMAIMHFHINNAQKKKYDCKDFCFFLNTPTYYKIDEMRASIQRQKSCKQLNGDKQHLSCIEDCKSTFSAKRLDCFEKCRFKGDSCREKCNDHKDTRADMTNYQCVSECNQDYKKRIQKYYKCIQKNPNKKCKMDGAVPQIEEENRCKHNWNECYYQTMMLDFNCRNKQLTKMCHGVGSISAVKKEMSIHCSVMKKGSLEEKDCRNEAYLYGYETMFACEDLYTKTILDRHQHCHKEC